MALQRVETDAIEDDAVTTAKIAANAVAAADIAADAITNVKVAAGAAIAVSKITGLGTAATLTAGTAANNVVQLDGNAKLPAIDGSNLTGVSTDTSAMENNIAILAFKTQTANNLAKFNLIDQVIDEYYDTTGIDASASTNELVGGSGIAKYYQGGTSSSVTTSSTGSVASTGTVDGDYTYYKWTTTQSNGTFTTDTAQDYEYLVVAGGGAGGGWSGAGGGAGGFRTATGFAVAATTITGITVGAGGASISVTGYGPDGSNSVFSTITSVGGGGGSYYANPASPAGRVGGSGGGSGGGESSSGAGGAGTANQGYAGGVGFGQASGPYAGGGGGGAAGVGGSCPSPYNGGDGGAGLNSSITGSAVGYAGGGGGSAWTGRTLGTTSHGGGAGGFWSDTNGVAGTANTGGGGGGWSNGMASGAGGSGIVVIRRPTSAISSGANLTLQSVANTALSAPTTGDICMLIENGSGTTTLNTDIKAWVSRNGGTGWDQATLVDKGTWGSGTKKIVTANNVAFSNSASGTDMRYKITTHNQSAGSKETRVHATSLAWA